MFYFYTFFADPTGWRSCCFWELWLPSVWVWCVAGPSNQEACDQGSSSTRGLASFLWMVQVCPGVRLKCWDAGVPWGPEPVCARAEGWDEGFEECSADTAGPSQGGAEGMRWSASSQLSTQDLTKILIALYGRLKPLIWGNNQHGCSQDNY